MTQSHQKAIENNGLGAENQLMLMVEWPEIFNGYKQIHDNGAVCAPQGKSGKGWKGLYIQVYLK